MKRAVLILALAGCTFAQKHPAVTVGIVTGTVGFGMCGLNVEKVGTCSIIGAGTGIVIGGITWLVTMLGETNAAEEPPLEEEGGERIETVTEPPPGLPVDAGAPLPDAALPDAPAPDAAL